MNGKQESPEPKPEKTRYPEIVALRVASEIGARLSPACERIVIAGSLRRRKPTVGDIEILFIPRMVTEPVGLFDTREVPATDAVLDAMLAEGVLGKRPLQTKAGTAWGALNKLAVHLPSGIPVDLFRTTAESWANYLVCRTGPADSNTRIATAAQRRGYRWQPYGAGFVDLGTGKLFPMASEREVFEFVGMEYLEPWDRK